MRTKDKIQEHQKNNDRYAEKTLRIEKETGRQIGQQQKKDTKETKIKLHPRRPQTVFAYPLQRLRACLWFY